MSRDAPEPDARAPGARPATEAPDGEIPSAPVKPGHGDHWLAALADADPRLLEALVPPVDAPDRLTLHRAPLTGALDRVQVTHKRRLVSAYPEVRATTLIAVRPRELLLWETRVEGWLTVDHPEIGALTLFVTDLAERADRYAAHAGGPMRLELGALAYFVDPLPRAKGPDRLGPARSVDPRFLADDYAFEGDVVDVRETEEDVVYDVAVQNGFVLPVTARGNLAIQPGARLSGYAWLTARWPS